VAAPSISKVWGAVACLMLATLAEAAPFEEPQLPPPAEPKKQLPQPAEQPRGPLPPPAPPRTPTPPSGDVQPAAASDQPLLRTPIEPPLGFAGPSGIAPSEGQETSDFVPIEDRWRLGFPAWDRYGNGHPRQDEYPFTEGHWWDPYNQNVLKGDYPIIGQHTFLNITAISDTFLQGRQVPTPANGFESTQRPGEFQAFGKPDQFFYNQIFSLSADLSHGDAAFKPAEWRIRLTPTFDINYLSVDELGVVLPDVRRGTNRGRTYTSLEEWFGEVKLFDLGTDYDFVSLRAGSQPFNSDFRGFLFTDTNRGVRLFGTNFSNRDQFNLVYFNMQEKNTDSGLNTFQNRHQEVIVANYYRQDFIWPGYTTQLSVHYDHDEPSLHYDQNGFLVRPDPSGVFTPHDVEAVYLGWAGDGHIGRVNITHQFYWALGYDTLNPLANQGVDINAQMAAIELSYDRDWARFRTSFFWASGDSSINNSHATGFDAIVDNPNFAGGDFSYWQSQQIKLLGVDLKNANSLLPDLRSSKVQGQANFVNPGLMLGNFGVDFFLTPKLKMVNNLNLLWFDETGVIDLFTYQGGIHHFIGVDVSSGFEYRPLLNNNVVARFGVSTLSPGRGFSDIYDNLTGPVNSPLWAGFLQLRLLY
jgi:hypothetical protein